jgi:hypothetical protein
VPDLSDNTEVWLSAGALRAIAEVLRLLDIRNR